MAEIAQDLPKKELPDRVHRELRKGETIYHSAIPCHVSNKFPEGKWIAQVRRDERGKLVKYPVKGFGTPKEALDYIVTLRPNERGKVSAARQGEATVSDLYEFAKTHKQKRIGERTKDGKESRWRLYIKPEWGGCPISLVTKRAAQEWVTEVETKIESGRAGTLGLAQFEKIRTDLHALFECLDSFSPQYEDRKNPFAGLDFTARPPRVKVTIESPHFGAVAFACREFASLGLSTHWVSEMFQASLLAGLREGEVLALCWDQIDIPNRAIVVDRSMRRDSREIDPKTRLEKGPVLRQAMNLPKGGSPTNDKARIVPMPDQLAILFEAIAKKRQKPVSAWDLIWPGQTGKIREMARFTSAWSTLRERLDELATLAPLKPVDSEWPDSEKRRGWAKNPLVSKARQSAKYRLPDIFGDIDFRDTRNSFASYMNEVNISQASRESFLGHGGGLTNTVYTVITSAAFKDAQKRLSSGWKTL